ncbi:MAG: polysaccharide deacetylase family protein [Firmicutes bacterium]|nr:polysaccharide deacetylase family protein [Bacillota bacterium]
MKRHVPLISAHGSKSLLSAALALAVLIVTVYIVISGFTHGVAAAAAMPDVSGPAPEDAGILLPIVMYHSTHPKNPGKYNVTPEQFERDICYIKSRGYTPINVADLKRYTLTGEIVDKPVMITLDDGYTNNYVHIFPLLKKYDVKCVMAVIGNLTDANYRKDTGEMSMTWSHLTYEQMREMSESGLVEIQNHTYAMHAFGKSGGRYGLKFKQGESLDHYVKAVTDDLVKWHGKLEDRAGVICTAVAYPFGSYNKHAIRVVKELGYFAGFTCTEKVNKINRGSDMFTLGRFNRHSGPSSEAFFAKLFTE